MIYIKPMTSNLSAEEKIETLMAGGILQDVKSGQLYKFEDNKLMFANLLPSTLVEDFKFQESRLILTAFINREFKKVELIDRNWYNELDNYPNGVLCFCGDHHLVKIVTSYKEARFITSDNCKFERAVPITKEVMNTMTFEN